MALLLVCPFCDAVVCPHAHNLIKSGWDPRLAHQAVERLVQQHLDQHVEEIEALLTGETP